MSRRKPLVISRTVWVRGTRVIISWTSPRDRKRLLANADPDRTVIFEPAADQVSPGRDIAL
ncbi:MAG: hypothetical protein QOF11_1643 [Chloroflexota bacterium]|jgi:hypothetical protein|nr:hypothetical protein [Chloroflexota bacterium]